MTACSSSTPAGHTGSSASSSSAAASSASGSGAAQPASGSSSHAGASPSAGRSVAGGGGQSGGINQIVPSVARKTKAPVPLSGTGDFGTGVTARLTGVTSVKAQAAGPGEVAGPGLKIGVRLTDGTDKAIDLADVVVTITDADGTPGVQMSQSGASPFRGTLAARASADAVYVFTIPAGHRSPVTVNLSYSSEAPVVLFVGDAN